MVQVRELNQTVDGLRKRKKIAIERLANTKKKLEEKDKAIAIVESNAKQLEERLKVKRQAAKECREKIQKIKSDFDGVISEVKTFHFKTMHGERAVTRKLVVEQLALERGFSTKQDVTPRGKASSKKYGLFH